MVTERHARLLPRRVSPGSRQSVERNLPFACVLVDAAVEAVEALEPRGAVGMSIWGLAVQYQLTAELDLIRGVVREEPRGCRVTQADLEKDGRDEKEGDDHRDERRSPGRPPTPDTYRHRAGDGHEQARQERAGARMPRSQDESAARTSHARGPRA